VSGIWRSCILIEKFEAQRIRIAMRLREDGYDAPFEANWFQRNIGILTSKWVIAFLAIFTVFPGTYALALGNFSDYIDPDTLRCVSSDGQMLLYFYVIGAAVSALLAFKIRSIEVRTGRALFYFQRLIVRWSVGSCLLGRISDHFRTQNVSKDRISSYRVI
jgi:hypothetical protein